MRCRTAAKIDSTSWGYFLLRRLDCVRTACGAESRCGRGTASGFADQVHLPPMFAARGVNSTWASPPSGLLWSDNLQHAYPGHGTPTQLAHTRAGGFVWPLVNTALAATDDFRRGRPGIHSPRVVFLCALRLIVRRKCSVLDAGPPSTRSIPILGTKRHAGTRLHIRSAAVEKMVPADFAVRVAVEPWDQPDVLER